MNGLSWLMFWIFLNPLKQATAGLSKPPSAYLLLSGPRPCTSSSWPAFTAWAHLGTPKPSTSSSHLQITVSLVPSAPRQTQAVANLGLHHLGNSRASATSGELQTMLDHHHPTTSTNDTVKGQTQRAPEPCWRKSSSVEWASAQLILHGRQRLVVSGHSQSLQLTDLGKSLPFTWQ